METINGVEITTEQKTSLDRLVKRYEMKPVHVSVWDRVLIADFGFIVIGIEPDGYAHS
jgi:hypothetical protein